MGLSEPTSLTSDWLRCPRPREPRSLSPRGDSCLTLLSRSDSGIASLESSSTGDSPNGTSARTSACRPRRGCCLRARRSGSMAPTSSSRFVCGTRLECVSVPVWVVTSRMAGSGPIRSELSSTRGRSRPGDRPRTRDSTSVACKDRFGVSGTSGPAFGSSTVPPHILGFDLRLLETPDFETTFVSDGVFNETADLGSTS